MIDALCVGEHPDDVEIGMGGTVAGMVREGMSVAIVDLTDGEPTPSGTKAMRAAEAARAAEVLGVDRRILDFPNRELFDTVEVRKALAEVVRELKPRILFAPYGVDAHPDHISASAIAEAARFYSKFVKTDMTGEPHYPAKVYHYWAARLWVVEKPSFIVDVSDGFAAKMSALECYASQFKANKSGAGVVRWVETQGAAWGALIGRAAAEPFYAREEVGIKSISSLL